MGRSGAYSNPVYGIFIVCCTTYLYHRYRQINVISCRQILTALDSVSNDVYPRGRILSAACSFRELIYEPCI